MDDDPHRQPFAVDQGVDLASLNHLAGVVTRLGADRSDTRRPRVDKFDSAPPSTSLFAITASLSPANHAIRGDTADFWVKRFVGQPPERPPLPRIKRVLLAL